MQVTFKGEPLEVKGTQPVTGDLAPNAALQDSEGNAVQLKDYLNGQVTILSVIPNVLTRTCELQTKAFADETAEKDYQFITVGRNTVEEFNQWNQDNDLNVVTLSDVNGEFGDAYGLNINLGGDELLTRAVFVIDEAGVIRYEEFVLEVADEPDYQSAIEVADFVKK
ncbi:peroxiredoxin [Suicoccus acidiformans]|nr:redoxin domain-containing protein [Suicoccus acidiformans]